MLSIISPEVPYRLNSMRHNGQGWIGSNDHLPNTVTMLTRKTNLHQESRHRVYSLVFVITRNHFTSNSVSHDRIEIDGKNKKMEEIMICSIKMPDTNFLENFI